MKITGLNAKYKNAEKNVFTGFDFEAADGTTVGVLGMSGIGKSTLLSCISGVKDDELEFSFKENTFSDFCSFDFQDSLLLPNLSLLENVALVMFAKCGKKTSLENASFYLKKLGLEKKMNDLPEKCSGGECGRAALARAFAYLDKCSPDGTKPLLLLDEPFKSQDPETKKVLFEYYRELKAASKDEGKTVTTVFVTHSRDEAEAICDSIVEIGR